jgi:hypothetical protein
LHGNGSAALGIICANGPQVPVLRQVIRFKDNCQAGMSFSTWGDSLHLGGELGSAELAAAKQFPAAWGVDNRAGYLGAVSPPACIGVVAHALTAAATARRSCLAIPAGCSATFKSVVDGPLADGVVDAGGAWAVPGSGHGSGQEGQGCWRVVGGRN